MILTFLENCMHFYTIAIEIGISMIEYVCRIQEGGASGMRIRYLSIVNVKFVIQRNVYKIARAGTCPKLCLQREDIKFNNAGSLGV